VQRHVLTTTIGHGETGFLGRSSDLEFWTGTVCGNGVRVYKTSLGFATRPPPMGPMFFGGSLLTGSKTGSIYFWFLISNFYVTF